MNRSILQAAWVAPMNGPIIRDGAVVIADGKILDVGEKSISSRHPGGEIVDLGNSILLPGLINAHTHLDLTHCHAGDPPISFTDWISSIPKRRANETVEQAVQRGIDQCLKFGVTCIGDITQQAGQSRRAISESPLRCVSYGEVLGLGTMQSKFDQLLPQAIDTRYAASRMKIGLSPHAPYTVDINGYRQCLKLASEKSLPLATHLAESPDERTFLESHSGPFRALWDRLGVWRDDVATFTGSPVQMANAIGLLDRPALLAHVNYCDDSELDLLARGKCSVVYCPRTHRYFGHRPHRWRQMLERGINVAVGTDSCASSPDLNIVEELRLLRQIAPEIPAQTVWEMATTRAARAVGMQDQVGSITRGKRADLAAFHVKGDVPLEELLCEENLPAAVWIDGIRR